jgi:hypothetical protein
LNLTFFFFAETNRKAIVAQGVLGPLVKLIQSHVDKGVQQAAVGTLWSLSYSSIFKRARSFRFCS